MLPTAKMIFLGFKMILRLVLEIESMKAWNHQNSSDFYAVVPLLHSISKLWLRV